MYFYMEEQLRQENQNLKNLKERIENVFREKSSINHDHYAALEHSQTTYVTLLKILEEKTYNDHIQPQLEECKKLLMVEQDAYNAVVNRYMELRDEN